MVGRRDSIAREVTTESPQQRAELRGIARTTSDSLDVDDLQPARAIRRALANGAMSAREIGFAAVHAVGPRARERAEHAVARGLGRFAAGVATSFDDPQVADRCVAAIERGEVSAAVALTIDPVAGNIALAFGRPR
jgi:hypothetical protein